MSLLGCCYLGRPLGLGRRLGGGGALELGGSDPFIVLEDADVDAAVAAGVRGRIANGGQACTASKRFIVVDAVYDEFSRKFIDAITKITPDDPTDPDTFLGPLASADAGKELEELVEDASDVAETAKPDMKQTSNPARSIIAADSASWHEGSRMQRFSWRAFAMPSVAT